MKKYYIVPIADSETYLPKMAESYGHNNISVRPSIDGTLGLMEFNDDNLPDGLVDSGYTYEEIVLILSGSNWTENADPEFEEEI